MVNTEYDDFERRALAAAEEERIAQEKARQERERRERAESARRQAEWESKLKTMAAEKLEKTIGRPSSPADWEVVKGREKSYYTFLRTILLGVEIEATVHTMWDQDEGYYQFVSLPFSSLGGFGKLLEEHKRRETQGK